MIFLKILNMGIAASWLIAAVFLLRLLMKKSAKMPFLSALGIGGCPFNLPLFVRERV